MGNEARNVSVANLTEKAAIVLFSLRLYIMLIYRLRMVKPVKPVKIWVNLQILLTDIEGSLKIKSRQIGATNNYKNR